MVRKGSRCISHVMVLGYSLLIPLAIQLPVNSRGGLGRVLCWKNSLPVLPCPAASCEHTHPSVAGVLQRGSYNCFPGLNTWAPSPAEGHISIQTKEKVCIGDARAWPSSSALGQKRKKNQKTRPMIMITERTAVKTAHKHCRMGLENILERKKKGFWNLI